MASSSKKRTTMAKLTRESRLRERRVDKQAKKDARKRAAAQEQETPSDVLNVTTHQSVGTDAPAVETVSQALTDV